MVLRLASVYRASVCLVWTHVLEFLLPRTLVCLLGPTNLQTAPSLACASTADVSYHSLQLLLITGVMSTHADIVVQPPSVGMTTDARGRPQYVPLKGGGQVHAQYITEGLVSGVLVLLGAGGLIVLERVRLAARRPSSVNRCAPLALCLLPSSLSLTEISLFVDCAGGKAGTDVFIRTQQSRCRRGAVQRRASRRGQPFLLPDEGPVSALASGEPLLCALI